MYDIYPQDIPEIDMNSHLPRWLKFRESLGSPAVEANDFLFPYIAPNGVIHTKRAMSYDQFQVLLKKFSKEAGLKGYYTTHCFRRGGAQYRFMFAPIGRRWTLATIRWWGGWAIGEKASCQASSP